MLKRFGLHGLFLIYCRILMVSCLCRPALIAGRIRLRPALLPPCSVKAMLNHRLCACVWLRMWTLSHFMCLLLCMTTSAKKTSNPGNKFTYLKEPSLGTEYETLLVDLRDALRKRREAEEALESKEVCIFLLFRHSHCRWVLNTLFWKKVKHKYYS